MANAETTTPDLPELVAVVCEPQALPPTLDTCEAAACPHNPDPRDARRLRDLFWHWLSERAPYAVVLSRRERKRGDR
ncbi:MAG: hypothetical protein KF901_30445 [Myxococcales bacterium]|nr:hypothetical protein [Myxococcales bacterium]